MTTEELIGRLTVTDRVIVNVFGQNSGFQIINICDNDGRLVLSFSNKATNWLELESYDARFLHDSFGNSLKSLISKVVNEYLNTPLDKRSSPRKYCLLWQKEEKISPWVLGYDKTFKNWEINNEKWLNDNHYQTRFTDADLQKIADGDQDMLDRLTVLKREALDNVD